VAIFDTPNIAKTDEHWVAPTVCCDAMTNLLQQDCVKVISEPYRILLVGHQMVNCPYCPGKLVVRKEN
jgi:hypothetical protein